MKTNGSFRLGHAPWNKGKNWDIGQGSRLRRGFGSEAGHWKGGRVVLGSGYVYIYSPDHPLRTRDNYVMEHRLVMEAHLGRYLERTELVHHKNGDTQDNRLENLELHTKASHSRKHFEDCKRIAELEAKLKLYEEKYGPIS